MSTTETARSFRLREWTVFPDRQVLVCGRRRTRERSLTPLESRLLLRLAEQPGEVVTKASLMRDVWEDAAVVDHVLPKTMSKLRASLGDDARSPRFIETVGRRGYRLVAAPEPADERPVLRRRWPATAVTRLLAATLLALAFTAGWLARGSEPAETLAEEPKVAVAIAIELDERTEERFDWKFDVERTSQ